MIWSLPKPCIQPVTCHCAYMSLDTIIVRVYFNRQLSCTSRSILAIIPKNRNAILSSLHYIYRSSIILCEGERLQTPKANNLYLLLIHFVKLTLHSRDGVERVSIVWTCYFSEHLQSWFLICLKALSTWPRSSTTYSANAATVIGVVVPAQIMD